MVTTPQPIPTNTEGIMLIQLAAAAAGASTAHSRYPTLLGSRCAQLGIHFGPAPALRGSPQRRQRVLTEIYRRTPQ